MVLPKFKITPGCLVSLISSLTVGLSTLLTPARHRNALAMCPLKGCLQFGFAVSESALPVLKQRTGLLVFILLVYFYMGLAFY